jgi:uncharacterized membrane protein
MLPDPIHPVIVHFPIVLAIALPIFTVVSLWTIARGKAFRGAWVLPTVLSGALTLSAFVALETGQAQEDRVESIVGEAPIHRHEEAAELFLTLSGALFLLTGAGLLGGRVGTVARYASTLGAAALVVAAIQVGGSGGDLVYRHGAGQAYLRDAGGDGTVSGGEADGDEHEYRTLRSDGTRSREGREVRS